MFFLFAIDFIQHKFAFSKVSTYYFLLQFSYGLGFVGKRFFAFEYYSVAYVFSMTGLIFVLGNLFV